MQKKKNEISKIGQLAPEVVGSRITLLIMVYQRLSFNF